LRDKAAELPGNKIKKDPSSKSAIKRSERKTLNVAGAMNAIDNAINRGSACNVNYFIGAR